MGQRILKRALCARIAAKRATMLLGLHKAAVALDSLLFLPIVSIAVPFLGKPYRILTVRLV